MKIDEERLVSTLQSLVKIPSFKDSIAISRWVKNEMEGIGYKLDSDEDGNLVTEIGKGPGFILNAHLDTVAPGEGWRHDPFSGEIEDGKLFGRGSTDCKAGVASMIEIARILKQKEKALRKRVVFAFTAFEEGYKIGMNGVYKILPKLKDIEKGLILEPTTHDSSIGIGVGCRGTAHFHLRILGEMGHSAYQPDSVNPIYKLPRLIEGLGRMPRRKKRFDMVNQLVEDKVTATEVCARKGPNVVPGECEVTIDRRSLPDEKPGVFGKALRDVCRRTLGNDFRLRQDSSIQGYVFRDSGFLALCKTAVKGAGGVPKPHFKLFRTDGGILRNFAGIGTFMIGPGTENQEHKVDEHCELHGLFRATEAVLGVIRRWDGKG